MTASQILLSYDMLRLLWWALLGIVLIGFAVLGGFDLGIGILLPFVARKDIEKRILFNSIGPMWEGNQVWFILGGGATFAAWPLLYAVAFSGFYFAMLLVLAALVLRPVGFDYRSKLPNKPWRSAWDRVLFLGGLVPSLIFGIAFGNLFVGAPFKFDEFMRVTYTGTLLDLLNPFALLCGIVSVLMLASHGAVFLMLKTEDIVAARARKVATVLPILLSACILAGAFWVQHMPGYTYVDGVVVRAPGAWWSVYRRLPLATIPLALALLLPLAVSLFAFRNKAWLAFITSAGSVAAIVANAGIVLFPFFLPSSLDLTASLTVWNSGSSQLTLFIMLLVTAVFLPLVGAYTIWGYHKMRGKVTAESLEHNTGHSY